MMLTREDFERGKGRLCIFTDNDKPCATMLVFVHAPGPDVGTWHVEYIRSSRLVQGVIGPVMEDDLTPLEHFGFYPEFTLEAAILAARPLTGQLPIAVYKDGRPRRWQGRSLVGVHPNLVQTLDALYA